MMKSSRALLALAALVGAGLVGVAAWYGAHLTSDRSPAASPDGVAPVAPAPARAIPENQLLTVPAPVPAPPLDLPTADGKRFSLAAARGKVVVVNFWATWCAPCIEEMPTVVKLAEELSLRHPGKFRVVAVSVDEQPGAVQRFFSAPAYGGLPRDVVVALDPGLGEATRAFQCKGRGACRLEDVRLPESYVLDPEGRIVALVVGYIDWSTRGARQYLEALLAR